MEFFAIVIVYCLSQLLDSTGSLQQDHWIHRLWDKSKDMFSSSRMRVFFILAVPSLAVLIALTIADSMLFGLVMLVIYVGALLFSLGRGDYSENFYRYLNSWNRGNFESAYENAQQIGGFQPADTITDSLSLHKAVKAAFLYHGFERWFSVIFWFLVLGPVGAVAYRVSFLSARSDILEAEDKALAFRIVHYLDWLPARLLVLSFTLTGNFVNGFGHSWEKIWSDQSASDLLDSCAMAALDGVEEPLDEEDRDNSENIISHGREQLLALKSLMSRSAICWLVVIAVLTLVAG
ncbi:MAG: regulatory signaling modulator protein AmpE [Oceanicoccus sp.]